jgi:prepilin-type N-terminal cleavage/methylation domain-containing protein
MMRKNHGFTLIELLLSLGILSTISVFAISMLSRQFEMRNKLTVLNEAQHQLHVAMERIFSDLRHANILTKQNLLFSGLSGRAVRPMLVGKANTVFFSSYNHRSYVADSPESNLEFVKYFERPSPTESNKKQLVRAFDVEMKESIEREGVGSEQVLIADLSEFKLSYWNGVDFTPEWDTTNGESAGKIPKMVKIRLAMPVLLTESEKQLSELAPTKNAENNVLESTVYLLYSAGQAQMREPSKEHRWQ